MSGPVILATDDNLRVLRTPAKRRPTLERDSSFATIPSRSSSWARGSSSSLCRSRKNDRRVGYLVKPDEVLDFWFGREGEPGYGGFRKEWFGRTPSSTGRSEIGSRDSTRMPRRVVWPAGRRTRGCLALVILLDQFPRNMYRGDPRSYATDREAQETAQYAVERALDRELPEFQRRFLYMPFMHSEDLAHQRRSVELFRELGEDDADDPYAVRHMEIVERFGRFPHRNEVLGRPTTPEESEFLKEPGSSFWDEAGEKGGA